MYGHNGRIAGGVQRDGICMRRHLCCDALELAGEPSKAWRARSHVMIVSGLGPGLVWANRLRSLLDPSSLLTIPCYIY